MRLRLIPLAPTLSAHNFQDAGAMRLFCSAREIQTHALPRRRTEFSGEVVWPSAEARVECACARYP